MWWGYYPIVMSRPLLEVAVQSVEAACAAERAGADRLELCVNLDAGGVTPAVALLEAVVDRVAIPVFAMVRPRAGDFVYSDDEMNAARRDVDAAITSGAAGLVLGVLRSDGTMDVERTRDLVQRARGVAVTFHRAFDETPDLHASLKDALDAGVTRVLTSGGADSALEGAGPLAALVRASAGRIAIVAGGGVRAENVVELLARTGVKEVHARFEDEIRTRRLVDLL